MAKQPCPHSGGLKHTEDQHSRSARHTRLWPGGSDSRSYQWSRKRSEACEAWTQQLWAGPHLTVSQDAEGRRTRGEGGGGKAGGQGVRPRRSPGGTRASPRQDHQVGIVLTDTCRPGGKVRPCRTGNLSRTEVSRKSDGEQCHSPGRRQWSPCHAHGKDEKCEQRPVPGVRNSKRDSRRRLW